MRTYFEMRAFDWAIFLGATTLHFTDFHVQFAAGEGLSHFLWAIFFALLASSVLTISLWSTLANWFYGSNGLTTATLLLYAIVGASGLMDIAAQNAILELQGNL
jgi:hypothetical protein